MFRSNWRFGHSSLPRVLTSGVHNEIVRRGKIVRGGRIMEGLDPIKSRNNAHALNNISMEFHCAYIFKMIGDAEDRYRMKRSIDRRR